MSDAKDGNHMGLASDIFTDMVLQEAIKDKTAQMEAEMNAMNGQEQEVEEEHPDSVGSDFEDELDDEFMDEESEKIMRSLKEQRLAYA
jgi:hypothetical protein